MELQTFFGKDYTSEERIRSYNFIETFISDKVTDWDIAPDTDKISTEFASIINQLDQSDFALLLCHAGYIPEFYKHDSSQETLYSKLIEVLICEWAKRIGFSESHIQKQKSSKEDVTIKIGNIIIVCDAKSYRLGRSQAAPNVKDTIKKADYEKWQEWWLKESEQKYNTKHDPIGGLITFPSLHRWKGSSDAYLYSSDKNRPIVIIFYEYLAYYYLRNFDNNLLISLIKEYPKLFPTPTKDQHQYFSKIISFLFPDKKDVEEFWKLSFELIIEKVQYTIEEIKTCLNDGHLAIQREIEQIPIEELKARLIESKYNHKYEQLIKQLENIRKFRPH